MQREKRMKKKEQHSKTLKQLKKAVTYKYGNEDERMEKCLK